LWTYYTSKFEDGKEVCLLVRKSSRVGTGRGGGLGGTEVGPRQQIEMTMKSFCFRVKNGTYRLNFGAKNGTLSPKNTYFLNFYY
jgi:hypothetical protein